MLLDYSLVFTPKLNQNLVYYLQTYACNRDIEGRHFRSSLV